MQLPCRHIFAVRHHTKTDLYSSELCAMRWTLAYYRSNHRIMAAPGSDFTDSSLNTSEVPMKTKPILSQHEKYRKAYHVTQKLIAVVSESPMREFNEKLAVLEKLLHMWEQGNEVILSNASDIPNAEGNGHSRKSADSSSCSANGGTSPCPSAKEVLSGSISNPEVTISNSEKAQSSSSSTGDEHTSKDPLKDISNLKLPPKQRKRGRPKGSELSVIGLPKKKHRDNGPVAFVKKHPKEKERIMLEWFVSSPNIEKALSGELLEDVVETQPEKVPNCCIDENVNMYHIKKYFTTDAWQVVSQVLDIKRSQDVWCCRVCNKDFQDDTVIACNCCLDWFHLGCVGLQSAPKRKEWFCRFCYGKDV